MTTSWKLVRLPRAKEQHPYEVPSVSSRPIDDGNPEYLEWIAEQTAS